MGGYPEGHGRFEMFEQLRELDHGWTVTDAHWLHDVWYHAVKPKLETEFHYVVVHAGDTARVLSDPIDVDFAAKQSIAHAFREVKLPYTIKKGDHGVVDTRESFELSDHIGIHFYDNQFGMPRGLTILEGRRPYDFPLGGIPDGGVDPGYCGSFSRQPKTYSPGMVISLGEVLGHGVLFFFPNGTSRLYGYRELGSHYQNQKETKLTQ